MGLGWVGWRGGGVGVLKDREETISYLHYDHQGDEALIQKCTEPMLMQGYPGTLTRSPIHELTEEKSPRPQLTATMADRLRR